MPATNRLTADVADRARGCLLGLLTGDCLGTTLEFSKRDSLPEQTEVTGGGPFRLRRGDDTDDSSMALAMAEGLLSMGNLNRAVTLDHWLAWYRHGQFSSNGRCFDIGNTTRTALEAYEERGHLEAENDGRGNGGIMRLAPVVLAAVGSTPRYCANMAETQSKLTHGSKEATACARALATACHGLVRGRMTKFDLAGLRPRGRQWVDLCRYEVSSSGLASHTLEAALWCVYRTESLEEALVLAVNLGDDSDTVGAVTGQIAGALYGASAVPAKWSRRIRRWSLFNRVADDLLSLELRSNAGRPKRH